MLRQIEKAKESWSLALVHSCLPGADLTKMVDVLVWKLQHVAAPKCSSHSGRGPNIRIDWRQPEFSFCHAAHPTATGEVLPSLYLRSRTTVGMLLPLLLQLQPCIWGAECCSPCSSNPACLVFEEHKRCWHVAPPAPTTLPALHLRSRISDKCWHVAPPAPRTLPALNLRSS